MSELNELSMVLIALVAIIIILILVLGYRKKQKYQESAEKAKQEGNQFKEQKRAMPSKHAAKFENGRFTSSNNPFGRNSSSNQEYTPYISDEPVIDTNQQELLFEPEPSISNFEAPKETGPEIIAKVKINEPTPEAVEAVEQIPEKVEIVEPSSPIAVEVEEAPVASKPGSPEQPPAVEKPIVAETLSESENKPQSQFEESNIADSEDDKSAQQRKAMNTIMDSDKSEPQTFALLVIADDEAALTDIHQFMMGNTLVRNNNGYYQYSDNQGEKVFEVVNLLNPGTFPENPRMNETTPGVLFILDLPCSMPAAAAMHDFIKITRKLATRIKGKVYNEQQNEINEGYYRSMRDSALGYDSKKITD